MQGSKSRVLAQIGGREREKERARDIEIREGRQEGKFRQLIIKKSEHHQEKENEEKKE